jgi:hypothetical protein
MSLSADDPRVTEDTPEWLIAGGSNEENRRSYLGTITENRSDDVSDDTSVRKDGVDWHVSKQGDGVAYQPHDWWRQKSSAGLDPYAPENEGLIDLNGNNVDDRAERAQGVEGAPSATEVDEARSDIGVQTTDETNTGKTSPDHTMRPDSAEAPTRGEVRHGRRSAVGHAVGRDRSNRRFDNTRGTGQTDQPSAQDREDTPSTLSAVIPSSTAGKAAAAGGLGLTGLLLLVVL